MSLATSSSRWEDITGCGISSLPPASSRVRGVGRREGVEEGGGGEEGGSGRRVVVGRREGWGSVVIYLHKYCAF